LANVTAYLGGMHPVAVRKDLPQEKEQVAMAPRFFD
jgi:hypothetical protein